ncbi:MAG: hypothetical protein NUV84_03535 [Candidatus Uhrbacteria bacterium]|nr:hypothetical protein [Candidatus Uhrbacteria bacterium]
MKKNLLFPASGWVVLGLVMSLGALFVWNARTTIAWNVTQKEEAEKPAEIELTLITPSACDECIDGNILIDAIQKQNVRVLSSETFRADSDDGKTLIETYGMTRVPAVLVRGEFEKENVRDIFASMNGEKNEDGTLILEISQPVYVDLTNNEIIGLVDVMYLTDSRCTDCYDPTQHKAILEDNFGVRFQSERSIDVTSSEGRALLSQYAITQIPTVLLSSSASAYDRLTAAWQEVGSVEEDGMYLFRQNEALGSVVYKDLETGETIRPETDNATDE